MSISSYNHYYTVGIIVSGQFFVPLLNIDTAVSSVDSDLEDCQVALVHQILYKPGRSAVYGPASFG